MGGKLGEYFTVPRYEEPGRVEGGRGGGGEKGGREKGYEYN